MATMQGFILTADWRDKPSHIIEFTVVGEEQVFTVRFTDTKPLFFVENGPQNLNLSNVEEKSLELKSFGRHPVKALYFQSQRELQEARENLRSKGMRTFESDVRPTERFLMERFIFGGIKVEGDFQQEKGRKVFVNPRIIPQDFQPRFRVLSLDIETGMQGQLYSIGLHFTHGNSSQAEKKIVLMVGEGKSPEQDFELHYYGDEKSMLQDFFKIFANMDPDIIIGWHVIGFDLKFLQKKCQEHGLKLNLGRNAEEIFIDSRQSGAWFARISGRVVMDGPPVLRGAFYNFESFKLDNVANELLGEGKDIEESGMQKVAEIERRFREDKPALAFYNLQDCVLVSRIFQHAQLLELSTTRTQISGMLFDRIGSSTGAFDYFFLPLLHRKGFVAPDILDVEIGEQSTGGHVLEPKSGLHQNVVVLDFKSLYPSIIRTFKIDPYSLVNNDINSLKTPAGIEFSRSEHILPGQIEKLMELRAQAKKQKNAPLSQAIKILMNSFYGVMGSGGCRFYNRNLPTVITQSGHWILKKSIEFFEESGFEVIYGDTDSVFVKVPPEKGGDIDALAENLAKEASIFLARLLKIDYGVESYLELEYEKHFLKFFLPSLRHGGGGAKKRYAGLLKNNSEGELYFAGLEVVRSDWTKLAKKFQTELFRRLFYGENIEFWIKDFVKELKDGELNSLLLYKRKLTKPLSEYTKSNPPHVKAARLLDEKGLLNSREVEYFITRRGPIPKEFDHEDYDYTHYIDKQIRPLADMVLPLLELSFDELIEGDQLSLF